MDEQIKTVLGTYKGTIIETTEGNINARAYVSKRDSLLNQYGFFSLRLNEGWDWWVITEYVPF